MRIVADYGIEQTIPETGLLHFQFFASFAPPRDISVNKNASDHSVRGVAFIRSWMNAKSLSWCFLRLRTRAKYSRPDSRWQIVSCPLIEGGCIGRKDGNGKGMIRWLILLVLLPAHVALSRPAEIILLRHAEKPGDDNNPNLSAMGFERARALPALFTNSTTFTTNGSPFVLFAARPTLHGSRRCVQTLRPTARALRQILRVPFGAKNYALLASHVLTNSALDGKTIVICWTHDYLPAFAHRLGVNNPPSWDGKTFDRAWVITYDETGNAVFQDLPQHLLPGDSTN